MWITEAMNGFGLTIEVGDCLCREETPFQKIEIYESTRVGRLMLLDGIIQLTEYDEFAYQEMMAHLPLFAHGSPRRVLVIGGGDGGVLREVAKHRGVERIEICEIDARVIECARKFLPSLACGFDDPRVHIHIGDGSEFVKDHEGEYDCIIVDSTDPGGPGAPLFGEAFYGNMKRALRPGGVIASQAESIYLLPEIVAHLTGVTRKLFRYCGYASILVPTYPTGTIGVCVGSDGGDVTVPKAEVPAGMNLRYYTTALHRGAFAVPRFAEELVYGKK